MTNEKRWGRCRALHTQFLDPRWVSGSGDQSLCPLIRKHVGSESISITQWNSLHIEYYPHCSSLYFCQNTHRLSLLGSSLWDYYLSHVRDTWFGQQEVSWNGTSHKSFLPRCFESHFMPPPSFLFFCHGMPHLRLSFSISCGPQMKKE